MRYAPDGNTVEPGVLREVYNFYPNNNGAYTRVPAANTLSSAHANGPSIGAAIVKNLAGTAKLYSGAITKVYQADGAGSWTDRSGGTTFAATTWDFCAFGDNVIAANGASKLQAATTGNFGDITDAPTGPRIVFNHANALVALGSTADGAAWARCKSGDHTTWTKAANNDADAGTLYGSIGGPITAGGPWENLAIAWKARAMYAAVYAGNSDPDQTVIRWQTIATDIGCVAQFAWVPTEVGIVFVSERGVMLFNGNKPIPIDADIRKTFMREAMVNRSSIHCTVDEGRNLVFIWVRPNGVSTCTSVYIWNYSTGLWGHSIEISNKTGQAISGSKTPLRNANYRDLVAIGGFATNTTETANVIFDVTYQGPINISGPAYTSASPAGDGFLRTGVLGIPGRRVTVKRILPVSDEYSILSTTLTIQMLIYDALLNFVASVATTNLSPYGSFDVDKTGFWFEMQLTADTTAVAPSFQKFIVEYSIEGDPSKVLRMEI